MNRIVSSPLQIREFLDCSALVIGHGAAMTYAEYMPDHAVVIEALPWELYRLKILDKECSLLPM